MYDFPANIGTSRHENDIIAILARIQRIGLPDNPIAFYGSSSFRSGAPSPRISARWISSIWDLAVVLTSLPATTCTSSWFP